MKTKIPLFFSLLQHQWKESIRSSYLQKSILINIILGIFLLYFLVNLILLGLFLGRILLSAIPDADPAQTFSNILLYYFLADFLLRFLMQPMPVLSITPYLHLPVRKNSLFHFLLLKSGLSLFNFFPLLIMIPFVVNTYIPAHNAGEGITWLFTILLLVFASNYLAFFFKKIFSVKPLIIVFILAITALLVWFDFTFNRVISRGFGELLMLTAQRPLLLAVPFCLMVATYGISWYLLFRQRYMEVKEKDSQQYQATASSRYLSEKFGIAGSLVGLEMKMIMRNNRPRTYLILSLLFMFYGFMIYPRNSAGDGFGMLLFIGMLLTGIMMIQYGQLLLSWESSYFDRLCTAGFSTSDYFTAKFWLFFIFNTATFLVSLPYAFFDVRILPINFAAWLFNCGINIFMVMFLGTYNTKKVDMNKGAFFNYEGVTAVHFIFIFPVMGLPFLIFWLVSLLATPWIGILVTGLTGLTGLLFHRQLIGVVVRQFQSRKQHILQGFRNG
jgi:hypothetical protein